MEMNAMLVEQVTKFFRSVLRPRRKIKICSDRKKGNHYSYGLGSTKNYTGIFFPPFIFESVILSGTDYTVPCSLLLESHQMVYPLTCIIIKKGCWRWFLYRKIFVCVIHSELIFFFFFFLSMLSVNWNV